MRQVIIILLLFMTNQVFSQFCETFNQYDLTPIDIINSSNQFQDNVLDNWGSICSRLRYSGDGGQGSSRHLEVFDENCPAFNGSWVFNNTDFSGNWVNGQQFSFDLRLLHFGGQATSITESIYIYSGNNPTTSSLVARYVLNDPIAIADEWVSIVPKITLMNQGSLPSGPLGYWEMVTGSDWDNLIQNVDGIAFRLDLSTGGSAAFGIDNICMQECEWPFHLPEEELFQEFPLCYGELPYVIYTKYFINPSDFCLINGDVIMDASSGDYAPQYINLDGELGIFTLDAPGEYLLELYAGGCHWSFDLVILPEIVIDLPSTYIACDGIFEEVCAPNGSNYTYEWYGPSPSSDESVLLETGECYTPEQFGSYNLVVTDEYGCTGSHRFIILEAIPEPTLNDCIGERIDINYLTYNNPNYEILWFHNTNLVQVGGTTLLTSYTSGTITVQIGYGNCPPVSTSVTLRVCCPEDMFLSVDCRNQQIVLENYPANFPGLSISSWTFNGDPIVPQGIFSSTFNTIYGNGVYGVSVLLMLPGGEECRFEETIVYREDNCCDLGPIANAQFVNIEGYETFNTIPHNNVEIPVLCDFLLNATSSICEEEYIINIAELEPVTWATNEVYPWTAFSGQAGMIDLGNFVSFQPGQAYLLSLYVGPNGTSIYLPFIYGLDAEVEITNADDYYILEGTKYGDIEVASFNCTRIELDGSASTCENSYQITIAPIDPVFPNWDTGAVFFENWYTGQAPNNISLPVNTFNGQPTGYYLLTFAVGPVWTPEYKLIWWDECEGLQRNPALTNGFSGNGIDIEEQISVYPNPTNDLINLNTSFESGIYDVLDVNGKIIKHGVLLSKKSSIDLSGINPGIYIVRVLDEEDKVYFKKVIKE